MIKFLDGRVTLYPGNCLEVLASLPENSIHSAVMDPPYHLTSIVERFGKEGSAEVKAGATGAFKRASAGFMGKEWDGGDIAFQVETWRQVLRVLKPGGYLLAFASTRGFGRMSVAIEDAGFITHPLVAWIFAAGMPKATRIKACAVAGPFGGIDVDGWRYGGQALKPAIEPIYMGQKPFSEENGTLNILRHGTGAININGCRIPAQESTVRSRTSTDFGLVNDDGWSPTPGINGSDIGRWPANLIHDGSDEVIAAFPESDGQQGDVTGKEPSSLTNLVYSDFGGRPATQKRGDTGSAARFFYSAKQDHKCHLCSATIVEQPSSIESIQSGNIVLENVAAALQQESVVNHQGLTKPANNAVPYLAECHPQVGGSVPKSAETWPLERIAQNVASAAVLCNSCATDIALALAEVRQSGKAAPVLFSRSIDSFKESILSRSLASYVAGRESTDIILTTKNLSELFGCVSHAIEKNTKSGKSADWENTESAPKRLFYSGKADADDRIGSKHPTVKPVDLMRYLVRLVTPPGGTVLDCFAGTGTTGEAAWREGFNAILIEREPEYQQDIAERMRLCLSGPDEKRREIIKRRGLADDDAGPLFGGAA